jgi:segregation and condensation protein A
MYKVKLRSFEGPFDLLVYLIETAEMNIYDIRISEITSQYLAYIREMEEQNIEVAEEFMVLAATLIEIKSRMVIPREDAQGEPVIEDDPRKELVQRILEYKKFKALAGELQEAEERESHVYSKPKEDISEYLENPEEVLRLEMENLVSGFLLFLRKKKKIEDVRKHYTRVERERSRMEHRIFSILSKVRKHTGEIFNFRDLVEDKKDKRDIIVTFTSVLEMAKERVIDLRQKINYGNIEIKAGENVEKDDILKRYAPEEFTGEVPSEQ